MCKYCNDSWRIATNKDFYVDPGNQKLYCEDEYDRTTEVNISFCPWCGRPLSTEGKNLYLVSDCQDASIYDMSWIDTEEEAKRIATKGLESNESRYLYTYRLVRTQKVFLPSECIFEDVE